MTLSSLTWKNMQTTSHQSQGQVCSLEGGVQERYSLTMVISLLIAIDTGDALSISIVVYFYFSQSNREVIYICISLPYFLIE